MLAAVLCCCGNQLCFAAVGNQSGSLCDDAKKQEVSQTPSQTLQHRGNRILCTETISSKPCPLSGFNPDNCMCKGPPRTTKQNDYMHSSFAKDCSLRTTQPHVCGFLISTLNTSRAVLAMMLRSSETKSTRGICTVHYEEQLFSGSSQMSH